LVAYNSYPLAKNVVISRDLSISLSWLEAGAILEDVINCNNDLNYHPRKKTKIRDH